MLRLLQQHLERVRARMKHQADKKRSDRVFQVGDSVYLKLQPYIQSLVAPRAHHKLFFKFYGPFKVLERVGAAAYRLQLPESSSIHPVLHVCLLKLAVGPHCQVQSELPPTNVQFAIPVRVLQRRFRRQGKGSVSSATWYEEPEEATGSTVQALPDKRAHKPSSRYGADEWGV